MSASHIDSDRLSGPPVGPAAWSDAEAAHLAGCAECRLELEILAGARRLGADHLARFDPGRVATVVRGRLAAEPVAAPARVVRHPGRWLAGLAAAAALVLAVRMWIPNAGPTSFAVVSVLHELDGLNEPQLEEVLQSIPPVTGALDHVEMVPLSDLNASDLERVLRSMEEP